MRKSSFIVIFITTSGDKEAKKIARALVSQKKAACVNIVPRIESFFWWKGKIDSAKETLLIVKTKSHLLDDVIKLVRKLHTYDVPEIIALPITAGNKEYLRWITRSLKVK